MVTKAVPFVVIEGLDGAGTTTQSEALAERLRREGWGVSTSCEPSEGPIGTLIRQMLTGRVVVPDEAGGRPVGRETLALLFAADRLDHIESQVEPALAAGCVAISDRYYHSSLVYQGDIDGEERVDYGWVRELNSRARVPDVTIFLEASVEVCMSRLTGRGGQRELYETREKLGRLERRYDEVMTMLADEGQPIVRLDASQEREALAEAIWDVVESMLPG
ncbi:dTMP kinase [Lujinxingia vulgaris]|uniref:Thymidylate kinase n=1 Tax=Lujinxingia vulgaris TaxID=2600176 RepID=A0A5C6X273_9DELT|nr:dTMP kinase [Lujinxingia vulgaris]TXD32002.1 dTMP kinase [Lujinxingia vulgaris]